MKIDLDESKRPQMASGHSKLGGRIKSWPHLGDCSTPPMDFPHGRHNRHHHHGGDEEDRHGHTPPHQPHFYGGDAPPPPPPFYGGGAPPPQPPFYGGGAPPPQPYPPPFYGGDAPPPVYHTSHAGPPGPDAYRPPPPPAVPNYHPSPPPPAHSDHHQHHHPPAADHRAEEEWKSKPSFRMYSKAEPNYALTIRDGKVILAPSDPRDPCQHWIKDLKFSTRVKDEEGFPSFALVNKATGQAIKHSTGATHPVQLTLYKPNALDESILWTESKDLGDSYRAIRMVNNIRLNIDAFNGDKNHGGVRDGTKVVLWEWKKGENQRWKIVPHCKCIYEM